MTMNEQQLTQVSRHQTLRRRIDWLRQAARRLDAVGVGLESVDEHLSLADEENFLVTNAGKVVDFQESTRARLATIWCEITKKKKRIETLVQDEEQEAKSLADQLDREIGSREWRRIR